VAFVGDRVMTDVLLANLNGGISILCDPLERSHEKYAIQLLRSLEELFLKQFGTRKNNPYIEKYLK
jgi:predicted HAD superfamily phosphohydrolase YqeG